MSIESMAAKKRRRNVSRKYGKSSENPYQKAKMQYRAAAAMAAYRRQSAKSNQRINERRSPIERKKIGGEISMSEAAKISKKAIEEASKKKKKYQ
jgi:hypothetical protein